jgi:hypothetical protein
MVTVAMRNGFAWAQRWELETSGPFTLRRRDFRNGSSAAMAPMSVLGQVGAGQRTLMDAVLVGRRAAYRALAAPMPDLMLRWMLALHQQGGRVALKAENLDSAEVASKRLHPGALDPLVLKGIASMRVRRRIAAS